MLLNLFIFRPPSSIMDLSVSNSTVIIALNSSVMRLNLMNTEELDSKLMKSIFHRAALIG